MRRVLLALLIAIGLQTVQAEELFLSTPVALYTQTSNPSEYCIALNVYYEARDDNLAGKYAVADVVAERVTDTRFPNTPCEVIKQGPKDPNGFPVKNKCQFSWYCDGLDDTPHNVDAWQEAQIIAWQFYNLDRMRGITDGSNHYHATYVTPSWAKTIDYKGQIGSHKFYKWQQRNK